MPPKKKGGLSDKKGTAGRGDMAKKQGDRSASPNQLMDKEERDGEQQQKRSRHSGKEKVLDSQETTPAGARGSTGR